MKTLALILLSSICYSQSTTLHFYYGSEETLGAEAMFHIKNTDSFYLGFGYAGALKQNRRERPIANDEKWCSLYAIGSYGYLGPLLVKYKAGLATYTGKNDFKEVLYKPFIGGGFMYPINDDIGVELGGDTFNYATIGFTVQF